MPSVLGGPTRSNTHTSTLSVHSSMPHVPVYHPFSYQVPIRTIASRIRVHKVYLGFFGCYMEKAEKEEEHAVEMEEVIAEAKSNAAMAVWETKIKLVEDVANLGSWDLAGWHEALT